MVGPPRYNEDHPHAVDLYLVSDNSISFLQDNPHNLILKRWDVDESQLALVVPVLCFPTSRLLRMLWWSLIKPRYQLSADLCFSLAIQSYCSWRATLTKDWKKAQICYHDTEFTDAAEHNKEYYHHTDSWSSSEGGGAYWGGGWLLIHHSLLQI